MPEENQEIAKQKTGNKLWKKFCKVAVEQKFVNPETTNILEKQAQELQASIEGREASFWYGLEKTLNSLDQKTLGNSWRTTVERIKRETDFLKNAEEFIGDELRYGGSDNGIVTWNSRKASKNKCGGFVSPTNQVEIAYPAPTLRQIWREFHEQGQLPQGLRTLQHERIHLAQHKGLNFLFAPLTPIELTEGQAYRTANLPPERGTVEEIVKDIVDSKEYPNVSREKVICAVAAIDKFKALGTTDQEIAQIISGPKFWDQTKKVYPALEREINKRRIQQGITSDGLDQLVKENHARRKIERLKAQIIAQEELAKLSLKPEEKLTNKKK